MLLLLHLPPVSAAIADLWHTISLLIVESSLFSPLSLPAPLCRFLCPLVPSLFIRSSLPFPGSGDAAEDELPQLQQVLKLPLSPLPSASNPMSGGQSGREWGRPQHESDEGSPAASSGATYPPYDENRGRNYNLLQKFYEEKERTLCGDKEGMPLIVSINRSVSAIADRPISLAAEFCCHPRPRKVFWVHRHLALAPGRIIGPYITKDLLPVSLVLYSDPDS